MKLSSTAIVISFLIIIYAWLGYSMIILKYPMLAMLVYHPVIVLGAVILRRGFKPEITTRLFDINEIKKPVHFTFLLAFITTALLWACTLLVKPGMIDPELISDGLESIGLTKDKYWLTTGYLAVVNPIAEEFFYRSALLPYFLAKFKRLPAVIFMNVIFAGYHPLIISMIVPPAWLILVFVLTFFGGALFAYLYMKTRSLMFPIILHLIANINLMFIGYLYSPFGTDLSNPI